MDNVKMAEFICTQRKGKGFTQRELAQRLGVTDKAVSKWERGLSCPDISLLFELSDILGVTTGELLSGEKEETEKPTDVGTIVESTLKYANTVTISKSRGIRNTFALAVTALSVLGIIVCVICNFAINGTLTWAWFPISSLIYSWSVAIPMILWGKRGVGIALILFSLLTIPFLLVLEQIIGIKNLVMPLGTPVSIISIIYLWAVFLLICKTKLSKHISVAASLLIGLPVICGINYTISKRIGEPIIDIWDIVGFSALIITSAVVFGYGYIKRRSRR